MIFYTNPLGYWPFKLIPYPQWKKGYKKYYQKLIIDPGVNNLIGKDDYPYINDYPLEINDPKILWVIPDYPFDIKPDLSKEECIAKTWENILKWYKYPNTICSVQYYVEDIDNFKENYLMLYNYTNHIGIGNLCKSKKLTFLKPLINFVVNNNKENKHIHFFGLHKLGIKHLLSLNPKFEVSVDSIKWDYGLHGHRICGEESNTRLLRWIKGLNYIKDIYEWKAFYKKQSNLENYII